VPGQGPPEEAIISKRMFPKSASLHPVREAGDRAVSGMLTRFFDHDAAMCPEAVLWYY
jgi:hypothetical protein